MRKVGVLEAAGGGGKVCRTGSSCVGYRAPGFRAERHRLAAGLQGQGAAERADGAAAARLAAAG